MGGPSPAPTLAGFTTFLLNVVGIPAPIVAENGPLISMAFEVACSIVNRSLACAPGPIYQLAVYNLGADNVINYGQDQVSDPIYKNQLQFFAYERQLWKLNDFVPGVVQTAGDESTNSGLVVAKVMENLTFANLQQLKTPWGRQYLAFAQSYGTLWGIS